MRITNIAGYKFISLDQPVKLRAPLLEVCETLGCKGTILLSTEGINVNLAGLPESIAAVRAYLVQDARFADMTFRESFSAEYPFKHMRVKMKKEIITMKNPAVRPDLSRAPAIPPETLKQWLDENRDFTLLDTRNAYEIDFGTFKDAIHLGLEDFSEFPQATKKLTASKPVVMFCTGGIRCEKAALQLQSAGFPEVYQLEGGILNYFSKVGGEHYQGKCFVFDERVALDANLQVN